MWIKALMFTFVSATYAVNFVSQDKQKALHPLYKTNGARCSCVCDQSPFKGDRILGGMNTKTGEFPFVAGLHDGEYLCGGSIITRLHILTAAHCITDFLENVAGEGPAKVMALIGAHSIEKPKFVRSVVKMAYHKQYDPDTNENDIGIVTINKPLEFSTRVQPACLPLRGEGKYHDDVGVVSGWGTKDADILEASKILQKTRVQLVTRHKCSTFYKKVNVNISEKMMCAGTGIQDACKGDSGGPLLAFNLNTEVDEVIGIVSFGHGCGDANFPGVYANVAAYIKWIRRMVAPQCLCVPSSG